MPIATAALKLDGGSQRQIEQAGSPGDIPAHGLAGFILADTIRNRLPGEPDQHAVNADVIGRLRVTQRAIEPQAMGFGQMFHATNAIDIEAAPLRRAIRLYPAVALIGHADQVLDKSR
jgi:hypothetical protein